MKKIDWRSQWRDFYRDNFGLSLNLKTLDSIKVNSQTLIMVPEVGLQEIWSLCHCLFSCFDYWTGHRIGQMWKQNFINERTTAQGPYAVQLNRKFLAHKSYMCSTATLEECLIYLLLRYRVSDTIPNFQNTCTGTNVGSEDFPAFPGVHCSPENLGIYYGIGTVKPEDKVEAISDYRSLPDLVDTPPMSGMFWQDKGLLYKLSNGFRIYRALEDLAEEILNLHRSQQVTTSVVCVLKNSREEGLATVVSDGQKLDWNGNMAAVAEQTAIDIKQCLGEEYEAAEISRVQDALERLKQQTLLAYQKGEVTTTIMFVVKTATSCVALLSKDGENLSNLEEVQPVVDLAVSDTAEYSKWLVWCAMDEVGT